MRILFIGGTSFVGRHTVVAALARGHDVTLFHRGVTGADLFPEAEHILGDRATDLGRLRGRTWDAAVDVCAYRPSEVRSVVETIGDAFDRYVYVSTCSVYRPTGAASVTEDSPLWNEGDLPDPGSEEVTAGSYGPLKALCEREARAAFDGRLSIVRPTYVIGPYDPTDRFTTWARRGAGDAEILQAAPPEASIQLIDGRDLGGFTLDLAEGRAAGVFNGVGPAEPLEMGRMMAACLDATGGGATVTWVDPAWLTGQGVDVEREIPLWATPEDHEVMRADPSRSLAAGLTLRPLVETIRDTVAWDRHRGLPPLRNALDDERQAELLRRWHDAT
jgi:nucleoside-diphosphate-sugar epimerase